MPFVIGAFFAGLIAGGVCLWLAVMDRHRRMREREKISDSQHRRATEMLDRLKRMETDLVSREQELAKHKHDWDRRIISYQELQNENAILKRDLQNIDVNLRKLELDGELRRQRQDELDRRTNQLATRYL